MVPAIKCRTYDIAMTKPAPLKFHQLSPQRRLAWLKEHTSLSEPSLRVLAGSGLDLARADGMIENVIGTYTLPLGIAQNFLINRREVLVPMVIEEPSVVAAASYMAKLARAGGGFSATSTEPEMIGQIQLLDAPDITKAKKAILKHKTELLEEARCADCTLTELGGGPRDLEVRIVKESPVGKFMVLHLIHDVRDAMGANSVNTTLERLAPRVEALTGGRAHLRILSNLADRRRTRAEVTIPAAALAFGEYTGEQVRDGILEAYAFAAADPYRAATHNKGIMNGIDAVVLATGNDWRAVEAGAHAYAARSGRYTSLTVWSKTQAGDLRGELVMPMAVGIVGGATRTLPAARACLELMGVHTANELAQIIVSVGLAQNLGALRALATEGIQKGHMALHARQVALSAGVLPEAIDRVAAQMIKENKISTIRAAEIHKSFHIEH